MSKKKPKSIYSEPLERFCRLLIEARESAGLSQEDVAERMGWQQSFVSKCEHGQRRVDVIEFLALAEAIGFDPAEFMRAVAGGK